MPSPSPRNNAKLSVSLTKDNFADNNLIQKVSNDNANNNARNNVSSIRPLANSSEADKLAREKSLQIDKKPSGELEKETEKTLGPNITSTINNLGKIKPFDGNSESASNDNQIDELNNQEENNIEDEEINDEVDEQQNPELPKNENQDDKYTKVLEKLEIAGYNFKKEDIDIIHAAGFKVKIPYSYIVISIVNFISSIVFGLIGLLVTVLGFGANATLIGGLIGMPLTAIGMGVSIMNFLSGISLSIASIISQIYYLKTASIVVRRSGVLVKYAKRLLTIRGIIIFFGWVPLLNGFIFLAGGRSFWRMVKRETKKVQDIIENEFKE